MPVLILVPVSGYIHFGQIGLILNYCLHILHTFLASSNNVNCMDSGFLQHCVSFLDYIYVFIAVDDIFHTFIFH